MYNSPLLLADDPCSSWAALDEPDRSQFHSIKGANTRAKCDRDGFTSGWYRFTGRAGSKMATECVPLFRCGTEKPVWLHGRHPTVAEGTVQRRLCFYTSGDCQCEWQFFTLVKNCSDYVVYRLMPTLMCDSRYCGDGAHGKYSLVFHYIVEFDPTHRIKTLVCLVWQLDAGLRCHCTKRP